MFITIVYKDIPELSTLRSSEPDVSIEKSLLVNPVCPVRVMLEYIRKTCKLGVFAQFDLCDETGVLRGLNNMPTYVYAHEQFEHKKTYYVIVLKVENNKRTSVLPQLNHDNNLYEELKARVRKYLVTGSASTLTPSPGPVPVKTTPAVGKAAPKKK